MQIREVDGVVYYSRSYTRKDGNISLRELFATVLSAAALVGVMVYFGGTI